MPSPRSDPTGGISAFQCSVKKGIRDQTFCIEGFVTLPIIVRECFSFSVEISGSATRTLALRGAGRCCKAIAFPFSDEDNLRCIVKKIQTKPTQRLIVAAEGASSSPSSGGDSGEKAVPPTRVGGRTRRFGEQ
ncbi:hypothetical protein Bca4012_068497 [Brassica carinata]